MRGHSPLRTTQIAKLMGPKWVPPGSCRPQIGPMLAHEPCYQGIHGCNCPSGDGGRKETDTALLGSWLSCLTLRSHEHIEFDSPSSMKSQQHIVKIDSEVWVTRLPSPSHPPLSTRRHRVTRLPPKNASAPSVSPGARWPAIIVSQVRYIQYLLACQQLQRSMPYNMVKSDLTWSRPVTVLRWPTVKSIVLEFWNLPDTSNHHSVR